MSSVRPSKQWQELADLVSALAADSVLIQQRLDAAAAQSRERFAAQLVGLPEAAQRLLMPLAPDGLRISEYRVSCSLRITTRNDSTLALAAAPLTAAYRLLHEVSAQEESRLAIEVRVSPYLRETPPTSQGSVHDDENYR